MDQQTTEFECVDRDHFTFRCEKCGFLHTFEADGSGENGWEFCPHRGRRIVATED